MDLFSSFAPAASSKRPAPASPAEAQDTSQGKKPALKQRKKSSKKRACINSDTAINPVVVAPQAAEAAGAGAGSAPVTAPRKDPPHDDQTTAKMSPAAADPRATENARATSTPLTPGEQQEQAPYTSAGTLNPPMPSLSADVEWERFDIEAKHQNVNCVHEMVRPKGYQSPTLTTDFTPAKQYPYTLDTFQRRAIDCLEKRETVLVSAHTSAGKTTVAEYAIAMACRDNQRIIYTSPIKALSNQKYRDLCDEFEDVGLMTGDVTIKPNASIMIMTTEILRSMLYRGSELCREMAWVVFDEVHYMKDRERGVVWEETMILLPDTIRMVFLSATIPNANEFAEWICRIKHQCCHLIYTDYRPVPLQHYLFPAGSDQVHLVLDELGNFREEAYQKAILAMQSASEHQISDSRKQLAKRKNDLHANGSASDLEKVIQMCMQKNHLPCIVFSFAKKQVEKNAMGVKALDLTTREEKILIKEVFQNAVKTLPNEDQSLPAIEQLWNLVVRGIGIHHGGLLPVMKEVVEILFQENLCKVLFATETFAMGVNMPAKTVVFAAIRKWDGQTSRVLNTAEYIQMAGRAGRRGKDKQGLTIVLVDEKIEPEVAKTMFLGNTTKLLSAFYLGYNMLLNLLRIEGGSAEYMIERSFHQFQRDKKTLARKEEWEAVGKRLELEFRDMLGFLENKALVKEWVVGGAVGADVSAEGGVGEGAEKRLPQAGHPEIEDANVGAAAGPTTSSSKKKKKKPTSSKKTTTDANAEVALVQSGVLPPPFVRESDSSKDEAPVEELLASLYTAREGVTELRSEIRTLKMEPEKIAPFLNPGRVVFVPASSRRKAAAAAAGNATLGSASSSDGASSSSSSSSGSDSNEGDVALSGSWGFVLNFTKKIITAKGKGKGKGNDAPAGEEDDEFWKDWVLNVFLPTDEAKAASTGAPTAAEGTRESNADADVYPLSVHDIAKISQIRAQQIEKKTKEEVLNARQPLLASLNLIVEQFKQKGGVPELSLEKDLKLEKESIEKIAGGSQRLEAMETEVAKLEKKFEKRFPHAVWRRILVAKYAEKMQLEARRRELERLLTKMTDVASVSTPAAGDASAAADPATKTKTSVDPNPSESGVLEDLQAMTAVLRKLNYVDESNVVQMKGKLACELSSADELLMTELVFRNSFQDLPAEYIVALISCMVFDENSKLSAGVGGGKGKNGKGGGKGGMGKGGGNGSFANSCGDRPAADGSGNSNQASACPTVTKHPELQLAYENMRNVANEIGRTMEQAKMPNFEVEKYVEKLRPGMMDLVLDWMNGYKFEDLMNATDIYEGSIIRVVRRLEELLRELAGALKTIGNRELETKLNEGRAKLKRGIIFAASLYL